MQTLYLGYNKILVVEGLECLKNLTILQVENQKLSVGESLCFDPRSILTLSVSLNWLLSFNSLFLYNIFQGCLKVLNISGNKMASLKSIKELHKLEVLDATNNFIDDINDLTESISVLTSLIDLSLQGNPVTQYYRCKENLIANNDTISMLVYLDFFFLPFTFCSLNNANLQKLLTEKWLQMYINVSWKDLR